ncbi:ComEC/Rec2 family competence protein [Arthrobacter sp. Soil763]|uniref:ComEC/Rec2 family competence protein n=1 Tax=Arthrobacter sp. Soil763 TaxID=1736402 RepID=UPI0009EC296A|nr:ComEC/Rec2 family competence protein [Arthrobacter sp. Soil763]
MPAVVSVWATAAACGLLEPAAIAVVCGAQAGAAALLLVRRPRRSSQRRGRPRGQDTRGRRSRTPGGAPGGQSPHQSIRATLALALLLSCAAGGHAAAGSVQRHANDVARAISGEAAVLAELDVAEDPRRLAAPDRPGSAGRWAVPATLRVLAFDGRRVEVRVPLVVMGGQGWEQARPGQRIRATGKLKSAGSAGREAGILAASSAPTVLRDAGGWTRAPADLARNFGAASAELAGDAAGLLPGMITGNTARLDPQLAAAMQTVGMTHLTAVSGANCSLVLGALVLAARSLRFPRPAAAAAALTGLLLFVLMVGPDASVLRAAVMGAVGLAGLAFGRAGRGLSLLCVATTGLLLTDPALATDIGFALSVVATLGIVAAGRSIMDWLPAAVPRSLAAALAVPLSAQLFCGPVIVLLQPQFSSYALPANLAAAVLVAPITLLGTAAVPLLAAAPALAAVPIAVAGIFAGAVAAIARYFAGLPGAALPWPEGAFGAATMAAFSVLSLAAVWLACHPAAALAALPEMHRRTARLLGRLLDRQPAPPGRTPPGSASGAGRRPLNRHVNGPASTWSVAVRTGLVDGARRGRLRVCKFTFRRNHQWLLPRPNAPGPRPRTPPPGAM